MASLIRVTGLRKMGAVEGAPERLKSLRVTSDQGGIATVGLEIASN